MTTYEKLLQIAQQLDKTIESKDKATAAAALSDYVDLIDKVGIRAAITANEQLHNDNAASERVLIYLLNFPELYVKTINELRKENKKLQQENAALKKSAKTTLMLHTTITDAVSSMVGHMFDTVLGESVIEKNSVKLIMATTGKGTRQIKRLPVNVDKLLKYCIAQFTKHQDNPDIVFSINDYAELCGRTYETPSQKKEFNKNLKETLDQLDSMRLRAIGKYNAASIAVMAGGWKITQGYVYTKLSDDLCSYLKSKPLPIPFVNAAWKISGHNPTAYAIADKMIRHYGQKRNIKNGTNDCLSVETLLKKTSLPTIDKARSGKTRNWKRQIQEPFEKALDDLITGKVITEWHYTYAKRKEIPFDVLSNDTTYEEWSTRYVIFTLDNA